VPRPLRLDLLCIGLDPLPLEGDFLGAPAAAAASVRRDSVQVPAAAADISRVGRQDFCAAVEWH
jgi:hypothetical protein